MYQCTYYIDILNCLILMGNLKSQTFYLQFHLQNSFCKLLRMSYVEMCVNSHLGYMYSLVESKMTFKEINLKWKVTCTHALLCQCNYTPLYWNLTSNKQRQTQNDYNSSHDHCIRWSKTLSVHITEDIICFIYTI